MCKYCERTDFHDTCLPLEAFRLVANRMSQVEEHAVLTAYVTQKIKNRTKLKMWMMRTFPCDHYRAKVYKLSSHPEVVKAAIKAEL